jgi:ABC-type lipoprotein release transport system permease subunit
MAAVGASPTKTVSEIFAFASIVVVRMLVMIALRRHRELALHRLVGATPDQIRAMVRGEAALIIVGLGAGLALRTRIDALGIRECDG